MTLSRKDTIELGIVVVLAILLVLGIISLVVKIKGPSTGHQAGAAQKNSGLAAKKPSAGSEVKRRRVNDDNFRIKFNAISEALPLERDPFKSGKTDDEDKDPRKKLILGGIIWSTQKPMAIINQTFLGEGDRLDQFTVLKVRQASVLLKDQSSEFELKLERA